MRLSFLLPILLFLSVPALAQNAIGRGPVKEQYESLCAACHGQKGEGGNGGSLIDGEWRFGGSATEVAAVIRNGLPDLGMVAYGETLSEEEIHGLVVYIRELELQARRELAPLPGPDSGEVLRSSDHAFRLEKVVEVEDDEFWSVEFFPDGTPLLAGFKGDLYLLKDGVLSAPIRNTPEVWNKGQGGLLEAKPHPGYEENGWIYLAYASNGEDSETGATRIVRGRIRDGAWVDLEEIFFPEEKFLTNRGLHFGCRLVFDNGYLFFPLGDRGDMQNAQKLDNPFGKVHRIHDDGRIPGDNPFVNQPGAIGSIWTYGNRNPQGLALDPTTGHLWETEHGPRGGDEFNWIRKGLNYGWPVITYGINYNGKPISGRTEAPGMEQPAHYWTPSIAACGLDIYFGDAFPAWRGDLFAGGLASQQLHRLRVKDGALVDEEILFQGFGRVRDVVAGPDGLLYLSLTEGRRDRGAVYRMVPVE